jgi:acetyltransferase
MIRRPRAHELIVGAASDPVFGPVILFGQGGTAVEAIADRAVALPPLNLALARDLISRTRVARLLAGYRDRLPVDHDALHLLLLQVSQLICDVPEIVELDINPLLADNEGVIALDARVRVARSVLPGTARLSIRPYPKELEQHATIDGTSVLLRPIRPEDAAGLRVLMSGLSARDFGLPLSASTRELPQSELARLTQIDYEREMTFVVLASSGILGAIHSLTDPDNFRAEFGFVIHSGVPGQSVERLLLDKLLDYLRGRSTREARCELSANNNALTTLTRSLGFRTEQTLSSSRVFLTLDLGQSHDVNRR